MAFQPILSRLKGFGPGPLLSADYTIGHGLEPFQVQLEEQTGGRKGRILVDGAASTGVADCLASV